MNVLALRTTMKLRRAARSQAESFFKALRRMTPDERNVVLSLIRFGCPGVYRSFCNLGKVS